MTEVTLSEERAYFDELRPGLIGRAEGRFALIKGRELLGLFETAGSAYEFGLSKLGNQPMFISRIQRETPVEQSPALALGLINAHL